MANETAYNDTSTYHMVSDNLTSTMSSLSISNLTSTMTPQVTGFHANLSTDTAMPTSMYFGTDTPILYYDDNHYLPNDNSSMVGENPYGGSYYDYPYTDYYPPIDDVIGNNYIYEAFAFEKTVYLYVWGFLIILTSLANILVIMVLRHRRMRNATNVILIAIAISDSLTGLVTVPVYIYAYKHYVDLQNAEGKFGIRGVLELSKEWCQTFMAVRYFVSRAFHTVSVWLTVMLGVQRFVSVSFPFRANSLFSVKHTSIFIVIVAVLSPLLHVYHAFDDKTTQHGDCVWTLEKNCEGGGCAYLWLTFLLMHFIPCILLVIFSVIMIMTMVEAAAKMKRNQLISNPAKVHKRDLESRRISFVVIAVVVVFLIPEIPYGVFLLVTVLLNQSGKDLLDLKTNRQLICVYELLVVLSFHANFWIYLVMNRKFRYGLQRIFDPVVLLFYAILAKFGIYKTINRRHSDTSSFGKSNQTETISPNTVSRTNSFLNNEKQPQLTSFKRMSTSTIEMKTYHFKTRSDNNVVVDGNSGDSGEK